MKNKVELLGYYGSDETLVNNIEGNPFKYTLEAFNL